MDETTKQARIMGEMRDDVLAAIGACAERHEGKLENATFLGAISWVLADMMLAANVEADEAFLDRMRRTVEKVRPLHDMEIKESVH